MRAHYPLLVTLLSLFSACTYDPAFDISCSEEGAVESGRRCQDGVWVTADGGTPTADGDDCEPRSEDAICADQGAACGEVTVTECGDEKTADCGSCSDPETCENNTCVCVPETEEELCAAAGATCGSLATSDRCGESRTVDCGTCDDGDVCGAGGTPNTCACPAADDQAFCMANSAECGVVTADDPVCETERTVNCGDCDAPESCGGGGTANQCGCMESDAEFCERLELNCGLVSETDVCGLGRVDVDCGTCDEPQSCGGGGDDNVCGCDPVTVCADVGVECGVTDVSAQCDNLDAVQCGDCGPDGTCMQNACVCDDGYAFMGTQCVDVDECATNTDDCDPNATCTNEPGTFTCACNSGYDGNGQNCTPLPPTIAEMVTGTGAVVDQVATDDAITGVEDDLYLVFVGMRTNSWEVTDVSGLGLTWNEAGDQCNASDEQKVALWWARGTPAVGTDTIVVDLDGSAYATLVAVFRVTNVPDSGSPGQSYFRNSNNNGSCDSSNPDTSYSFDYTVSDDNALLLAGTTIFSRSHTPGAMWTEQVELHEEGQDREGGLAVQSRTASAGSVTVDGIFSGINNWATALIEVRGL